MRATTPRDDARRLLESLFHELFQTERSAEVHCAREASRLGQTPPAIALRAVSEHARGVNARLPMLAAERNLPHGHAGRAVGEAFSTLRRLLSDPAMDAERSYRGTLLGARHGVDVVRIVGHLARRLEDAPLAAFCDRWLSEREPLVQDVEAQLEWFAEHPTEASARATHPADALRELAERLAPRPS